MDKIKVFIVDDHVIVSEGLKNIIDLEENMEAVGCADSFEGTMKKLAALQCEPNIILVDINLKGKSGIELIREIKSLYEKISPIVLSMYDEELYAAKAFDSGAKGYVSKSDDTDVVINAINTVFSGQLFFKNNVNDPSAITTSLKDTVISSLTSRELEIFRLYGLGYTTKSISNELHISTKTVQTYRDRIREHLGLANSNEIVLTAIKWLDAN